MRANTAKEQSLEEFINELTTDIPAATTIRNFWEKTGETWSLETLKRLDYPEDIYFVSGRNRIFKTRELTRYLLTRGNKNNPH